MFLFLWRGIELELRMALDFYSTKIDFVGSRLESIFIDF